jgi:hypothetical protein
MASSLSPLSSHHPSESCWALSPTDRRDHQRSNLRYRLEAGKIDVKSSLETFIQGYEAFFSNPDDLSISPLIRAHHLALFIFSTLPPEKQQELSRTLAREKYLVASTEEQCTALLSQTYILSGNRTYSDRKRGRTSRHSVEKKEYPLKDYKAVWEVTTSFSPDKKKHDTTTKMLSFLDSISERKLGVLQGQGIEEAKGGFSSLINIMLEGLITKGNFGALLSGNPSCFAGPYGPYYVVADDEKTIFAYIVHTEDYITHTHEALEKAVGLHLISEEDAINTCERLISADKVVTLPVEAFRSNNVFAEHVIRYNRAMKDDSKPMEI